MKKFEKYGILLFVSLLLNVFTFTYAAVQITGLNQTVSEGDIITAEWYNVVNKFLNGPHTEGGTCSYSDGKILCNGIEDNTYVVNKRVLDCYDPSEEAEWYKTYHKRCGGVSGIRYREDYTLDDFLEGMDENCGEYDTIQDCNNATLCDNDGDTYITNTNKCRRGD